MRAITHAAMIAHQHTTHYAKAEAQHGCDHHDVNAGDGQRDACNSSARTGCGVVVATCGGSRHCGVALSRWACLSGFFRGSDSPKCLRSEGQRCELICSSFRHVNLTMAAQLTQRSALGHPSPSGRRTVAQAPQRRRVWCLAEKPATKPRGAKAEDNANTGVPLQTLGRSTSSEPR